MLGFSNQSIANFLFWVTRKKWLITTFIVSLYLFYIPTPEGLSSEGHRTLIIAITTLILIVSESIQLPAIAILILIMEVILGIDSPDGVASSFMSDAVFFIMGSLMLAVAIVHQGWDKRIALGIIKITGNKTQNIIFGFLLISAIMASFIGEHTVAAIMLPIAISLVRYTSSDKKKVKNLASVLLFSIAYGALIGSVGTPSGGGRNVIMLGYLKDSNLFISYLEWMIQVYPFILVQIPIVSWILIKSFPPEYIHLDTSVRKLVVQVAKSASITRSNIIAGLIFLLVFLGWIFFSETFGLGTIALIGVFLFLVAGYVEWDYLSKHTHWGVILLFGSTISLGSNIKSTGAAEWLADIIVNFMGNIFESFPFIGDTVIIIMTTTMANVLSSSATVAVLGPITMNMGENTLQLGLITAIASAFGYFTAIAAPACTIIYSSGLVSAKDFLKVGWKVGLISIGLLVLYKNTYWALFN
jgi:sodium-dependent dicarboxylate transporter 2/3/5|tara:strand:- start:1014 stop:2426 length:1413 start_codon:yes stop_codon:yes gene_type:complete